MEQKKQEQTDYILNYKLIITIIAVIVAIAGIAVGFPNYDATSGTYDINVMFMLSVWGSGAILIIFLNMLKDIINELRILNSKIK